MPQISQILDLGFFGTQKSARFSILPDLIILELRVQISKKPKKKPKFYIFTKVGKPKKPKKNLNLQKLENQKNLKKPKSAKVGKPKKTKKKLNLQK